MIRAIFFPDYAKLQKVRTPGSFHLKSPARDGCQEFWYYCPCGCGQLGVLIVGLIKPTHSPSWHWNGSDTEATLHPSVHHVDHWHGWLKNGYWEAV